MKTVIFVDSDGYQRRALLRDDDPESMAECGIPAGPPDLRHIGVDELLRDMNNLLVQQELFTWDDVQRKSGGLTPVLSLLKRRLVQMYRQESVKNKT
jgi:hypothetical protein